MDLIVMHSMLADASDLMVYVLPALGSMLFFYGIYQVFTETQSVKRKRMKDRLIAYMESIHHPYLQGV